jgi:phage nucleotide-binding protein
MQVKGFEDVTSDGIKALIYSEPGNGKTTLAATLDLKRTLIISFESGLLSILDESGFEDLQYVEPSNLSDLKDIYDNLKNDKDLAAKYDTIFIDSLSEISDMMLEALKQDPTVYTGMKDNMKLYMINQEKVVGIAKSFRDLKGYNVIMTALAATKTTNMVEKLLPSMAGQKLADKLPPLYDFVWYLEVTSDGVRRLITQPTSSITAKSRSRKLESAEEPNLGNILLKIKG